MSRSPSTGVEAWLGLDLGTSGLKALVVGPDGEVLAESERGLSVRRPQPGHAEAEVAGWTRAVDDVLASWDDRWRWRGVGVTGQMHGTVLLDAADDPLAPAVLWPDTRAEEQRDRWDALPPRALGDLGGPWSPGMTGPTLAWLAEHDPLLVDRAAAVALPKDVVRAHLTGGPAAITDPSDAAGTLLRSVTQRRWSDAAARLVPHRLLPQVRDSAEVVGLWRDAPVVVGGGDTPVSLLALGAALGGFETGDLVVNLGTGAQVIDPVAPGDPGPGWSTVHTYDDCHGGRYAMVAAQNAGLALTWAADQLGVTWESLSGLAAETPAGALGWTFAPWVAGERGDLAPTGTGALWTPGAGADSTGVRARAAIEAEAFLVRRAHELLGSPLQRVVLAGGGGREPWIRQLVADVLGAPVVRVPMRSAAARGAAALAGARTPELDRLETCHPGDQAESLDQAYARWVERCYG